VSAQSEGVCGSRHDSQIIPWQYWHVPALSGPLPPSPAPPGFRNQDNYERRIILHSAAHRAA